MTRAERLYVINEVITTLNTPLIRSVIRFHGRQKFLPEFIDITLKDDFPEIATEGERNCFNAWIVAQTKKCSYPSEKIPLVSSKLNLHEVLFLSDLNKVEIEQSALTLESLSSLMQDNEDERAEIFGKAFNALKELLKSKGEPCGVNL